MWGVFDTKDSKLFDGGIIFKNMIFSFEVQGFLFFFLLLLITADFSDVTVKIQ